MYDTLADEATVRNLIPVLREHGIEADYVETRAEALASITRLIPADAEVNSGFSTTLEEIGFVHLLKTGSHRWNNVKAGILAETDPVKQHQLRRRGVLSEYFLGSVHAVTQQGQTLTASGTGSQIPAYAYTSPNVIWVVGTQKIVPTLADGFTRIHDYVFPLEDRRMKALGFPGTSLSKIMVIEREISPLRRLRMILVNERLGF
jgi:hypothetical protein